MAIPLTVILNSNHTKKFVLLLPSSEAPKETILREARNKFRTKGLSFVFLRGGRPLDDGIDLNENDTQVWISKGEIYNGPPARSWSGNAGELRILAEKSFIDASAIKQLRSVAGLEFVRLAVGMPDLHPGNRFPVGCAIAAEGIYPALIGSDVGCGIALYRLSSRSRSLSNPAKLASMLKGLDEPWDGDVVEWLSQYGITRSSNFDAGSLGTVGAGNHFAEICSVERIVDNSVAESLGVHESGLYLLVHTGSRGLGGSILRKQTADDPNPFIGVDTAKFTEYLAEHDYAVLWAIANRDLVAYRIKECLFRPSHDIDDPSVSNDTPSNKVDKILDVTHNSVTKHGVTIDGVTRDLWIHRKGAAPADKGVAPCPGSRGSFSWLLQPAGDGNTNGHSLAHGAGRRFARNALHEGSKPSRSSLTTTALGSEVVCTDPDLLLEERPEAYKDIECVVEDMESMGMCQGVAVLRPVVTYKVREAAEARK